MTFRVARSIALVLALAGSGCTDPGQGEPVVAARPVSPCAEVANPVWVVANTHGTATGWLTGFSSERNYMINNYASLMDLAETRGVPFVFSEVPTAIAMTELEPDYLARLKALVADGRASLTNAFAVEYDPVTVTWPTFEKMASLSRSWQEAEFGKQPDVAWYIDALGHDPQMAEALEQLGIGMMVTERSAETLAPVFILEAASGAEIIGVSVKSYAQWRPAFKGTGPLPEPVRDQLVSDLAAEAAHQPDIPFLWLIGASDYSRAPEDPARIEELVAATEVKLGRKTCFGTTDDFRASLDKALKAGAQLPHVKTPSLFAYNAFRANLPQIKQEYRALENTMAAWDAAASVVSVAAPARYPAQALSDAWWMTLLNGDRALVWGNGADSPFIGPTEWNVRDRTATAYTLLASAAKALQPTAGLVAFDPIGWTRGAAYELVDRGMAPESATCEAAAGGEIRCLGGVSAYSGVALKPGSPAAAASATFTGVVETPVYHVVFNTTSGDIASLTLKSSGKVIARNANRIVWTGKTEANKNPADFLDPRASRPVLGSTSSLRARITQSTGPLFTTVRAETTTPEGAKIVREVRIPHAGDRIEFDTQTAHVPMKWVVSASFGLSGPISQQLRGVTLGYERDTPRPLRDPAATRMTYDQTLLGLNDTVAPAIRWSSHVGADGGFALLDRGLLGREWGADVADILLLNTEPDYRGKPNELLSGVPELRYAYALVGAAGETPAAFARAGQEYNTQPVNVSAGVSPQGFVTTDTVVIQGVSREGSVLRIWGVNASEAAVTANIAIPWAHTRATLSGAMRKGSVPLTANPVANPPNYSFELAPRDAFQISLQLEGAAPLAQRPQSWSTLAPEAKLGTLTFRDPALLGHPPE